MSFLLPHFLKEGRGTPGHVLHARLQPALDEPGRLHVDGSAEGRIEDRRARRADADLERDGVVRRLRPADGPRHRAARHDEPGDARRALARIPAARHDASRSRSRAKPVATTHRGQSRRGLGGSRILDRAVLEDRSGRLARHPQVISSRRTGPASRSRSTSTTAGCSRTPSPACPRPRPKEGLTPLQYMRRYGAFQGRQRRLQQGARAAGRNRRRRDRRRAASPGSTRRRASSSSTRRRSPSGAGPNMPFRATCRDTSTGATSIATPNEFDLLPNFRLPTLIHTRSPVKWLYEISHNNPLWISTDDAAKLGIGPAISSRSGPAIGYFVTRAWVTEGIRPGVVAMSHHLGRWRLNEDKGGARGASALVKISNKGDGKYEMRQVHGAAAVQKRRSRTARASGGTRSASTRTSRSPCSPIR